MSNFKCEPANEARDVDLGSVFFEIGCSLLNKKESDPSNCLSALWFGLGMMAGSKPSQMNLGMMLSEGRGVPEDMDLSITLLKQLANSGDKNAKEAIYCLTTPDDQYVCEDCRKSLN